MTLRVLFLLMLCACLPLTASAGDLPTPEPGPVLRIQGSNTIGAALGPALVEGLMREQGLLKVHSEAPDKANELRVVGETVQGRRVVVDSRGPRFQHRFHRPENRHRRSRRLLAPDQGQRTG